MGIIPHSWFKYHGQFSDWVTYYGDIHNGILVEAIDDRESFFVLSRNQLREFNELGPGQNTAENLRKLAWEFRDASLIKPIELAEKFGETAPHFGRTREQKWQYKKMFIFGAGASSFSTFGSSANELKHFEWRPPLAYELFDSRFDEIIDKYPGASALIPDFEASGKDIELAMEKRWGIIRHHYSPKELARYVNTQFYLQELTRKFSSETERKFKRNSLYNVFADKVRQSSRSKKGTAYSFVSFNYDTLLDNALSEYCELDLSSMQGYVPLNERPYFLLKPHGSYNWGWNFSDGSDPERSNRLYQEQTPLSRIYYEMLGDINKMTYQGSWGLNGQNHKYRLSKHDINKNQIKVIPAGEEQAYFPALLVPLKDKDELLIPYDHQQMLDYAMAEVEEMYVIGWKGGEELFNNRLKQKANRLKKIIIVNPDLKGVKAALGAYLDLDKYDIEHVEYFDDFVLNHLDGHLK